MRRHALTRLCVVHCLPVSPHHRASLFDTWYGACCPPCRRNVSVFFLDKGRKQGGSFWPVGGMRQQPSDACSHVCLCSSRTRGASVWAPSTW